MRLRLGLKRLLASAVLGVVGHGTAAETWAEFYRLKVPDAAVNEVAAVPTGVCLSAILDAQARYQIPDNLLLAIGLQESGRKMKGHLTVWPWTANSNGKGHFFASKQALEAWVTQAQDRGAQSIDVGCMQVNQKWHAHQFASLQDATDPVKNVDYAARFLRSLHAETRDWWQAAGRYHSSTDTLKATYLSKLTRNQKLANSNATMFAEVARAPQTPFDVPQKTAGPSINWSSEMTGTNAAVMRDAMSIYSSLSLQPILPGYAEVE